MHNTTRTRQILMGVLLSLSAGLLVLLWLSPPLAKVLPQLGKLAGLVVVGLLAIAALVWGIQGAQRLLARWFPVAPGYELTYTLAHQRTFQREYRFITLLYFLLTPLIGYLAYLALADLAGLYYRLIPAVYLMPVERAFWAIPAIFLGISLSGIPIWFFNQWRLKERFPRLLAFFNQQYRYDQRKAGLAFTTGGLVICLALVLTGLNLYVRLTPELLAGNRFFGLVEKTYRYDQITRLEEHIRVDADNPDRVVAHWFLVGFADGKQWQKGTFGGQPVPPVYRQALEYASRRSGQPVETVIE